MTTLLDYSVPRETLYSEYCRLHKEATDLQTVVHTLMESPTEHHTRPGLMALTIVVLFGFCATGVTFYWQSHRMDDIEKGVNKSTYAKAYCGGV